VARGLHHPKTVAALEVVNIEHNDSDRLSGTFGTLQFAGQCLIQVAPVVQAGQRVADGLLLELLAQAQVCQSQGNLPGDRVSKLLPALLRFVLCPYPIAQM
jgi:hypothetical protein